LPRDGKAIGAYPDNARDAVMAELAKEVAGLAVPGGGGSGASSDTKKRIVRAALVVLAVSVAAALSWWLYPASRPPRVVPEIQAFEPLVPGILIAGPGAESAGAGALHRAQGARRARGPQGLVAPGRERRRAAPQGQGVPVRRC